jgi:hypothetical protein
MNLTHNEYGKVPEYINKTEHDYHKQSIRSGMMSLTRPLNPTAFMDDPYIRQQRWGNNIRVPARLGFIPTETPLDVENNLMSRDVHLSKYCSSKQFPQTKRSTVQIAISQTINTPITQQSRASHPAWMYKDKEQTRWDYLPLDPQENVAMSFSNNLSSRILAKNAW